MTQIRFSPGELREKQSDKARYDEVVALRVAAVVCLTSEHVDLPDGETKYKLDTANNWNFWWDEKTGEYVVAYRDPNIDDETCEALRKVLLWHLRYEDFSDIE